MNGAGGSGIPGTPPEPPTSPDAFYPPSTPTKAGSGRGRTLAVAAIVVAVLAVLAGLYLAGIGPFARPAPSSSHPPAGPESFSAAWAVANGTAASEGSGPWSTYFAGGVDLSAALPLNASLLLPTDLFSSLGACAGTDLVGAGSYPLLPAYSGNLSSGDAPLWDFLIGSPSAGLIVLVGVLDGQGTVWEKFAGSECAAISDLAGALPGNTATSGTAVQAALDAGGSGFVEAHPGGSLLYTVEVPLLGRGGDWGLDYTTCPTSGSAIPGTTYYEFNASVGLTNGTLLGDVESGTVSCGSLNLTALLDSYLGGGSGSTPLSSALSLGSASANSSTEWLVPVVSAAPVLVIEELVLTVVTSAGASVSSAEIPIVELLAATGCGLAEGTPGFGAYVTPVLGIAACSSGPLGADAPVKAGESFAVIATVPGAGNGDVLEVSGQVIYSGSVTVVL